MASFQECIAAKAYAAQEEKLQAEKICKNFFECFDRALSQKPHARCRNKEHRKAYRAMLPLYNYLKAMDDTPCYTLDEGGAPHFHCHLLTMFVMGLGFEFHENFNPDEIGAMTPYYLYKPVEEWKGYLYLCLSKVINDFPMGYANYL